jgi:spore coat polysaccharide biosynthesis protein SpsF
MTQAFARAQPRVVAVIQARMGSTRLPGKVLKPIAGQPLIWHIVHRLRKCRLVADIAVATSINPGDEAIVEWADTHGVPVVRGAEDDVLARHATAAEKLDADIIVRVSCDAPFIDPGFVDHMVAALIEQDGDYVVMADETGEVCGVDPFSRRALDRLMMDARHDPRARADVTGYFRIHPGFVKIVAAAPYAPLTPTARALTVDTPDDLAFVEALHARVAARAGEARLSDLLLLLERDSIAAPPRHSAHQSGRQSGGLALIRCDGGGKFGYGHVKRMVNLARALRDREGIGALFALNGSEDAAEPIRRAGFECVLLHGASDLETLMDANSPDMLLLDGREGPSRAELAKLARGVAVTAVMDDAHDRRLAADYAYYPPVPAAATLDWSGSDTLARIGWEWSLLGLNPNAAPSRALAVGSTGRSYDRPAGRPTVLVTMGGSDPHGLTLRMAKALSTLDPVFRIRFVIGTGMKDAALVARGLVALKRNYETVEGAADLSTEYASADLALCAFGVTAYELAAFGVPAIYLGLTEDHAASASAFADAGMGLSLGVAGHVPDGDIAATVRWLLNKPAARRDMRARGLALMDGNGAARVAADLASALQRARMQAA